MKNTEIKSGARTTEFYLTLLTNLLGGAVIVELVPNEGVTAKLVALSLMVLSNYGYTVSRGLAKRPK